MVFPILLNELGLIGLILFLLCFFVFFGTLLFKSLSLNNIYVFNFILISFLILSFQLLLNLLGVLGIIPLKGINVPFLSYGGSSIVSIIILMFLNLSILKIMKEKKE
jgi:cell division protein FtsW (lipid II flippase)